MLLVLVYSVHAVSE